MSMEARQTIRSQLVSPCAREQYDDMKKDDQDNNDGSRNLEKLKKLFNESATKDENVFETIFLA